MSESRLTAELRDLRDRIDIQDVICAVTLHSDLDEPEAALALYVPGAAIDYSAVSGPDSANIPVEQHRRNLASFLPGFDKRQHQTTNFEIRVTGDDAASRAQVRAIHLLDGEMWLVHGTYHHRLVRTAAGWRITYQRADVVHQEGTHLVPIARQRVSDRAVGPENASC
ncbi:MAG: nuclear transport factor 2 family protein [Rhizorhabdus sp.]